MAHTRTTPTKTIRVRVETDIVEALDELARRSERKRSGEVRVALRKHVEEMRVSARPPIET